MQAAGQFQLAVNLRKRPRKPSLYDGRMERQGCRRSVNVAGNWKMILGLVVLAGTATAPLAVQGQLGFPDPSSQAAPNPLSDSTVNPGKMLLFDLEARFAKDVLARGGAAFADWFAEDGVALGNGAAPLVGRVAIAKSANWDPKVYQLTWTPTEAQMGPSGDVGYTWGHFEGHSKDANGNPVVTSGRYITIWRKQPDGNWKVVLDAGANEPAGAGDCCKLPATN
jgi:ketosteroid isomerase-like protein